MKMVENGAVGGSSSNSLNEQQPSIQAKFIGSYSSPIGKLRGRSNYSDWAFSVKMTLIQQGFRSAIEPQANESV